MTAVDVRHAGGTVTIEPSKYFEWPVVDLALPGVSVPLYPAEAVRLAVVLIAAAHRVEQPVPDGWADETEPPC